MGQFVSDQIAAGYGLETWNTGVFKYLEWLRILMTAL
jgi:hypothetical protein